MPKSPMRIVELCVYVLIIIFAVVWLLTGRKLYKPPIQPSVAAPSITQYNTATEPPPAVLPRGDVFPQ